MRSPVAYAKRSRAKVDVPAIANQAARGYHGAEPKYYGPAVTGRPPASAKSAGMAGTVSSQWNGQWNGAMKRRARTAAPRRRRPRTSRSADCKRF